MNALDITMGYMAGHFEFQSGVGKINFLSKEYLEQFNPETYKEISLRDLLFSTLGSINFTYRQQEAVNKLYKEYVDDLDFTSIKLYVSKNKDKILPSSDIPTTLKLMALLELAFKDSDSGDFTEFDFDAHVELGCNLYTYDLSILNNFFTEEGRRVFNKIKIYVFKNKRPIDIGSEYFNALYDFINLGKFQISSVLIFSVVAYSGEFNQEICNTDQFNHYAVDDTGVPIANKIIKSLKPFNKSNLEKFWLDNSNRSICEKICKELQVNQIDFMDSIFVIKNTIGYEIKDLDRELTTKIFYIFQYFNNIASNYNLSVSFLSDIQDRLALLKRSFMIATNFYSTEEEIIIYGFYSYFSTALLQYIREKHEINIDRTLDELVSTYEERRNTLNLEAEVERLKMQLSQRDMEISRLNHTLKTKNTDKIHDAYYDSIKTLSNEIKELTKENESLLDRLKEKQDEIITEQEPKHDIDIRPLKFIVVGHPKAEDTVKKLNKKVSRTYFVDGIAGTATLESNQLKGFDYMIYQWEFLQHKAEKYASQAKSMGVPVIMVRGTNLDYWLKQIQDTLNS